MKNESRSVAVVVATLAVGMVLGMLLQGMLLRVRTQRVDELRRPEGFVAQFESAIQPTPAQRDSVHRILDRVGRHNDSIIASSNVALKASVDSLLHALEPLLSAEQNDRVKRMSRLPDPFHPAPDRRRPPGPPDGERPPGGPR